MESEIESLVERAAGIQNYSVKSAWVVDCDTESEGDCGNCAWASVCTCDPSDFLAQAILD
jgi:hypothetical protein